MTATGGHDWSDDARRVYTAAFEARETIATALLSTPHHLRNGPRPVRPWRRRHADQDALLEAFFKLDMAIDSWAYTMGPEGGSHG